MTVTPKKKALRAKLRILFGRRWVHPRELAGLDAGSVIDLAVPADDDVAVSVNGRPFASGKAVSIDGKLGVRLTDVPGPPDAAAPMETE